MSTHTPGPWELGDELAICAAGDVILGALWLGTSRRTEQEANAVLATAAPDLLAALKKLVPYGNAESDVTAEICWEDIAEAQAAIAKAEGRS